MRRRWLTLGLFSLGVFLLFVHTTLPALWQLAGFAAAYPLGSTEGLLGLSAGFTPPLGTAFMLAAGFVHGARPADGNER